MKIINVDGEKIKLTIWDTAGQERFRNIIKTYFKGVEGIILAYDITNIKSFENVKYWTKQVKTYAQKNVVSVLVGNKCDLEGKRKVNKEDGLKLAKSIEVGFFETSSKENINVKEIFEYLSRELIKKESEGKITKLTGSFRIDKPPEEIVVKSKETKARRKKCCK